LADPPHLLPRPHDADVIARDDRVFHKADRLEITARVAGWRASEKLQHVELALGHVDNRAVGAVDKPAVKIGLEGAEAHEAASGACLGLGSLGSLGCGTRRSTPDLAVCDS
jgi:hypothetical protein